MLELTGKYAKAKIFSNKVDEVTLAQIYEILGSPVFKDEKIRIMSDCHKGKGAVIGFTSTFTDSIIPNLIGVDIGCGVNTINLGKLYLSKEDLDDLDVFIRKNIPHGTNINSKESADIPDKLRDRVKATSERIENSDRYEYFIKSLGSLGGGNHFIEMDEDEDHNNYLVIHSGSRNFGNCIAQYYQKQAVQYCFLNDEQIKYSTIECRKKYKKAAQSIIDRIEEKNIFKVPKDLAFLQGVLADQYLEDMRIAQKYAVVNRAIMEKRILDFLKVKSIERIETIHNYISDDNIIRKGAVNASLGVKLLIPINMRDGSILAVGKGNPDWNSSAPHGAGRLLSRSAAKDKITLNEFQESMKGIYTTSISLSTIDESPMVYKPMNEILENIKDTVKIKKILKPIYNFKSN